MIRKILFVLSILSVTAAFATETDGSQGSENYGNEAHGLYSEIQVGSANSSDINAGVDNAGAARLDLGYKFSPYMGLEFGLTGVANPTAGTTASPLQIGDVSFKGFLPITSWFDLHAQTGLGYVYMAAPTVSGNLSGAGSEASLKAMFGAGMDIYLTKSFALVFNDYMYVGSGIGSSDSAGGNTNIVMGGLKYDF